jgi:hypothetical protein
MTRSRFGPQTAAAGLVGANLVPLVGVLALGWGLHSLLVVYWLESAVVGVESIAKMLTAQGDDDDGGDDGGASAVDRGTGGVELILGNLGITAFFMLHYGIFWLGHGAFVFSFPEMFDGLAPASPSVVATAFVSLAAYHAVSFLINYIGEGEYRSADADTLMSEPYRRVVVLHLTILGGSLVVANVGTPLGALAVMVLVKTVLDLRAHWQEHERARKRTGVTAAAE